MVFKNTHEPIIDEALWKAVQKLRMNKRRPTRQGEQNALSGLLFCADCGQKLYLCRAKSLSKSQKYYVCSTYRKHKSESCSPHTIRTVILEQLILEAIQKITAYVSDYEQEFINIVMDCGKHEAERKTRKIKKTIMQMQNRYLELDNIFKKLYEDNISGKLSDERFTKLSAGYESEQEQLKEAMVTQQREYYEVSATKLKTDQFIEIVHKYTHITELSPEILYEFIDKVIIHAPDTSSGKRIQKIDIIFNGIGEISI